MRNCLFTGNGVYDTDPSYNGVNGGGSLGGAIYNTASLCVEQCAFLHNSVVGGPGGDGGPGSWPVAQAGGYGGSGLGGAVYNYYGDTSISSSLFATNTATGGAGGQGGSGVSPLPGQSYYGGAGGSGGSGSGGALYTDGRAALTNCTFAWNVGTGGRGGPPGQGIPGQPGGDDEHDAGRLGGGGNEPGWRGWNSGVPLQPYLRRLPALFPGRSPVG